MIVCPIEQCAGALTQPALPLAFSLSFRLVPRALAPPRSRRRRASRGSFPLPSPARSRASSPSLFRASRGSPTARSHAPALPTPSEGDCAVRRDPRRFPHALFSPSLGRESEIPREGYGPRIDFNDAPASRLHAVSPSRAQTSFRERKRERESKREMEWQERERDREGRNKNDGERNECPQIRE